MKKKKIISIIVFIIGLATLITGVVFLVLDLTRKPAVSDGEYLVSVGKWALTSDESVVWSFTEIGKGSLTTNAHVNDYDFIWAIEDGKLKIETKWLYDLQNEYTYSIDKSYNTLTLEDEEGSVTFTAASKESEKPEESEQSEE